METKISCQQIRSCHSQKKSELPRKLGFCKFALKLSRMLLSLKKAKHKGEIMAVQAEYDAKKQLIKNSVVADKKRRKVCLDARDKAKGDPNTKD